MSDKPCPDCGAEGNMIHWRRCPSLTPPPADRIDLAQGRKLVDLVLAHDRTHDVVSLQTWLWNHSEALLELAEADKEMMRLSGYTNDKDMLFAAYERLTAARSRFQ